MAESYVNSVKKINHQTTDICDMKDSVFICLSQGEMDSIGVCMQKTEKTYDGS